MSRSARANLKGTRKLMAPIADGALCAACRAFKAKNLKALKTANEVLKIVEAFCQENP